VIPLFLGIGFFELLVVLVLVAVVFVMVRRSSVRRPPE